MRIYYDRNIGKYAWSAIANVHENDKQLHNACMHSDNGPAGGVGMSDGDDAREGETPRSDRQLPGSPNTQGLRPQSFMKRGLLPSMASPAIQRK